MRLVKKIVALLEANNVPWPGGADNAVIARTHATRDNLSAGAWLWFLRPVSTAAYYPSVGSQYTATEIARGPSRVRIDLVTGDYELEPA